MLPVLRWHAVPHANTDAKDNEEYKKQQANDATDVTVIIFLNFLLYTPVKLLT